MLADNSRDRIRENFMKRRLMLFSNSTQPGQKFLEYCAADIAKFLKPAVKRIHFIPYAAVGNPGQFDETWNAYLLKAQMAFTKYKLKVYRSNELPDSTEAIFIGGGNTHNLLYHLHEVRERIRYLANQGVPIIGTSAGSVIMCPTIKTTNDMPIIDPPSLNGIGLVNFQINAHYFDPDPNLQHQGETRQQRIAEYHKLNPYPVLGLREGSWLKVEGGRITLHGNSSAKLFVPELEPVEYASGSDLSFLWL